MGTLDGRKSYSGGASSSIEETSNGGFIVSGRSNGPWLLRLKEEGNIVWQRLYGGRNDFLLSVQQTKDHGFLAGGSLATNCCGYLAWALKLDSTGSIAGCCSGVPSNATITDTRSFVIDEMVKSVSTNAIVTQTGVSVGTNSSNVQTQCIGSLDGDHEQDHHHRAWESERSATTRNEAKPVRTEPHHGAPRGVYEQ